MGGFRSAGLWGPDHTQLGAVAVEELPPHIAIALSRGRYPKGYAYLDPNEDGVVAVTDGTRSLLAVVDGHNGFDAAQAALQTVLDAAPSILGAGDIEAATRAAFAAARAAVAVAVADATGIRATSATGLTIATVASRRFTLGTLGDAQGVVIRGTHARRVGSFAPFLDRDTTDAAVTFDRAAVQAGDLVLVATDGLFAFLGRRGLRALARAAGHLSPTELALHAVEAAGSGGGGDNVAVAVAALAESPPQS